jgi:hypothetical protein
MELRRSCVRDQGPDRRGAGNPPPASSTPRGSIQDATRVTASASATSYGGALAGAVRLGTRTFEIVADQRGCSSSIHPPKARRRGRTGYRQRRSQSFSIGYNGRPRYAERGAGLPARTASPWSWDRAARAYQHKEPGVLPLPGAFVSDGPPTGMLNRPGVDGGSGVRSEQHGSSKPAL